MSKEPSQRESVDRGRDERGATLAVVAASMVVVLGMGALAVDVGMLYTVRTKLQATADASALGGRPGPSRRVRRDVHGNPVRRGQLR